MPKFESSRLNGVAVIAKTNIHTYPHTYILPNLGNTLKKNIFRGDWKSADLSYDFKKWYCHLGL